MMISLDPLLTEANLEPLSLCRELSGFFLPSVESTAMLENDSVSLSEEEFCEPYFWESEEKDTCILEPPSTAQDKCSILDHLSQTELMNDVLSSYGSTEVSNKYLRAIDELDSGLGSPVLTPDDEDVPEIRRKENSIKTRNVTGKERQFLNSIRNMTKNVDGDLTKYTKEFSSVTSFSKRRSTREFLYCSPISGSKQTESVSNSELYFMDDSTAPYFTSLDQLELRSSTCLDHSKQPLHWGSLYFQRSSKHWIERGVTQSSQTSQTSTHSAELRMHAINRSAMVTRNSYLDRGWSHQNSKSTFSSPSIQQSLPHHQGLRHTPKLISTHNSPKIETWCERVQSGTGSTQSQSKQQSNTIESRRACGRRKQHLLQFIQELLHQGHKCVQWVSKERNEFSIVQPEKLTHLWGRYKHNNHMTFDSLSRSLRLYYAPGKLERVHGRRNQYRLLTIDSN